MRITVFWLSLFTFLLQRSTIAASPALTDQIDFSDAAAVQSHQFKTTGDVSTSSVGDFVGEHDERRTSLKFNSINASASIALHVTPAMPATIEIEERWGREHGAAGYLILVDGRKTYFRTWEANGAGPVHYFVQIPATNADHVTLQFVNESNTPFAISRIWSFADLPAFVRQNQMEQPFYLSPTVSLKWKDYDADLVAVTKIKSSFGEHQNAKPSFTVWIAYARRTDEQMASEIDESFKIAQQLQMPVQICFDSWWGNTPNGPDGHGGKWNDEKYQQVVWNETQHKMQMSVPNQWSNTPWLTMNNADLNAFKTSRLAVGTKILREKYHALAKAGHGDLLLAINLDNEPIYWASGNAGLGPDLLWADFNPATVAAAARDGIKLDPTDGLSRDERLWLWKNLLRYDAMIANCVAENLGDEPMQSASSAGADLMRNNIYTQAMMMSQPRMQYPMFDVAYPLWEHAAPASARVGGEWNANVAGEIESVMHQIALGRCAETNAECGNRTDHGHGIAPGYALGMRYYTLYNYPLDQMQIATAQVDDASQVFETFVHEPAFQTIQFADDSWKSQVQSSNNVATQLLGNTTAFVVHAETPDGPGVLNYVIKAPHGKFDRLAIEISSRAFRFHKLDPNVNIRVLAGDPLRPMGTISDTEGIGLSRIDLTNAARGKDHVNIRIELNAMTLDAKYQNWVAIDRIRFLTPWPDEVMRDLPQQDRSMKTSRLQNLLVSWRADAEQEIGKLPEAKRADAQSAFDRGEYQRAYQLACEQEKN